MNCYEWRKHITGSVSVSFTYSEAGEGYTITGNGTITHGALYNAWTRRELQCNNGPLEHQPAWILRGPNLCDGRSQIVGLLTPSGTVPVTITAEGLDPVVEDWSIFWQITFNDYEVLSNTLLPLQPYPDWENDPYSVAARALIDNSEPGGLLVGIASSPPSPGAPSPSAVPLLWLKDGQSGTSPNGFLSATVACNFTLA
jgi:hypothetical protein